MRKPYMRSFWLLLTLSLGQQAAYAANPFSGDFLYTEPENAGFVYISLTQAGPRVSGTLQFVRAGQDGKSVSVTSQVDGVADQNRAALRATDGENGLSLRREGKRLVAVFPRPDGGVVTNDLMLTTEDDVARRIGTWRTHLASVHAEQKYIRELASRISNFVRKSTEAAIPNELDLMRQDLAKEQTFLSSLRSKRAHFDELMAGPLTCDAFYAKARDYYYSEIFHAYFPDYSSAAERFANTANQLQEQLNISEPMLRDAQSNLGKLQEALARQKFPAPTLSITPEQAQRAIAAYRTIVMEAPTTLAKLQALHEPTLAEIKTLGRGASQVVEQRENDCHR